MADTYTRMRTTVRLDVLAEEANVDNAVADAWRRGKDGVSAYSAGKLASAAAKLAPNNEERAARARLARQGTALLVLMDGQATACHVAAVCGIKRDAAEELLAELAGMRLVSYHAPLWQLVDWDRAERIIDDAARVVGDIERTARAHQRVRRESLTW